MWILVCGRRGLGSCDYFHHEVLGELCVRVFAFHLMFVPVYVQHTHLHTGGGRVVDVEEVKGATRRSIFWGALRGGLTMSGIVLIVLGLAFAIPGHRRTSDHQSSAWWLQALLCFFLGLVALAGGIAALVHKPRAPPEAQEAYLAKLTAMAFAPYTTAQLTSRPAARDRPAEVPAKIDQAPLVTTPYSAAV